jgi:Outer membrane protein beta-barrel domain
MRSSLLAWVLLLIAPASALAEWQLKPFVGVTFGGATTFVDLEKAVGKPNPAIGVGGTLLGEVLGIEGDLSWAPGFFQTGRQKLVVGSSVATGTVNLVVAMPRRFARYSLRPYAVAGGGFMHVRSEDIRKLLPVRNTESTIDIGGGATGFLTNRIGVNWDVRYFRSLGGPPIGLSFGTEKLRFWRASMAAVVRVGKVSP